MDGLRAGRISSKLHEGLSRIAKEKGRGAHELGARKRCSGQRRDRLEASARNSTDSFQLSGLLREVRTAIAQLESEGYGVCQVCHDLIGQAAMNADPIARTCLACFTPEQLSELEKDLDRAWVIQGELLPKQNLRFNGWEVSYHYEPAGPVSGDYCDLVSTDAGDLYFLIGDVAGKGGLYRNAPQQ